MNRPDQQPRELLPEQPVPDQPVQETDGGLRPSSLTPVSDKTPHNTSGRRQPKRQPKTSWAEVASRTIWLLGTAGIVFGVWRIGPRLVEEYHFSARLGQARAEYQNAVHLLKDQPLANVSNAYRLVAQKIRPSVVSIGTTRPRDRTRGQGSGVLISSDGYVLTNSHVVDNAATIKISLFDRRQYTARLIGSDPESDLAVVKIDAPALIPATWGESDLLEVGSLVWAIGSPYGLDQTVTSGIVSGKHRRDRDGTQSELLQTDAAVNPGNSGGPLVDALGNVIGINTSIFGDSYQGISFAVPSATARFVVRQLIEKGTVTRGYIGVTPGAVRQRLARQNNMSNLDGAMIKSVQSRTPADHAGFQFQDVIIEWNGNPITVHSTLFRFVEMTPPNSTVPVKIIRDGVEKILRTTVGSRSEFVPAF